MHEKDRNVPSTKLARKGQSVWCIQHDSSGKKLVRGLEASSNEIRKVEDVINQVTKHTKLIALNASIEAMCAREAGLGFSVVVEEIRKLADKVVAEIQQKI